MRWLDRKFARSGLCEEDYEECFSHAVEVLMKPNSDEIKSPMGYIFIVAERAALDFIRERKRRLEFLKERGSLPDSQVESSDLSDASWTPDALVDVAEVALDDEVTPRTELLRTLFSHVLSKLSNGRRRLAELLLENGTTTSNAVLADMMDRDEGAIKVLKHRTLGDVRRLFPECAEEMGIGLDRLLAPDVDSGLGRSEIPSDDDSP